MIITNDQDSKSRCDRSTLPLNLRCHSFQIILAVLKLNVTFQLTHSYHYLEVDEVEVTNSVAMFIIISTKKEG